ncbi:MAG: hypothetical protein HOM21_08910, partial [Halobacteriovoraceae bacterium]|nr:hypothetical protein [Halobacteriovoraceae bacterium]
IKVDKKAFEVTLYAKPGQGMNYAAKKSFKVSFSGDERLSTKTIEEKYKSGKIKGQRVVFYKASGAEDKVSTILSFNLTEDKSAIKEVVIVDFSQVGINRVKPCWNDKPVELSKQLEF